MNISADIPVLEPNSQFSGYSRAGQWHILWESTDIAVGRDPCAVPEFSLSKIKHQQMQAFRSIDEERALPTTTIKLVKQPARGKTKRLRSKSVRAVINSVTTDQALRDSMEAEVMNMKAEQRKIAAKKASDIRWGKK